ncbi:MAG: response regulator [Synechococcales cyanobacterium CRU_2_2]|nr:response regulator [Synechococcales cyanobacterium CRU_2_2]
MNDEKFRHQGRSLPESHERFLSVLNGKRSVRDLAVKVQKDLTTLARLLATYYEQGIIELAAIEDLPQPEAEVRASNARASTEAGLEPQDTGHNPRSRMSAPPTVASSGALPTSLDPASFEGGHPGLAAPGGASPESPLVMCIDDSPQICYIMEQMLTQAGYRVVCIQESVEAVSSILRRKPAFIFLDLVMPVASGYELCKQIRRVSAFKDIPIVILTGNDGVIDRVRAKMVGATDFVGKPVKADKIIPLLDKYLNGVNLAGQELAIAP